MGWPWGGGGAAAMSHPKIVLDPLKAHTAHLCAGMLSILCHNTAEKRRFCFYCSRYFINSHFPVGILERVFQFQTSPHQQLSLAVIFLWKVLTYINIEVGNFQSIVPILKIIFWLSLNKLNKWPFPKITLKEMRYCCRI